MERVYERWSRFKSATMYALCAGCALGIVAILVLVMGYLLSIGVRSLSWEFFAALPTGDPHAPGGMRAAIVGTLILIGVASAVGIPVGMLAGIHLAEYTADSKLVGPVRFICDVLSGVPSIVVGILGYELLVVPLGSYNGWAGAMALAFIMVPIVARTSEEMLRLVPNSYREASIALGASKARTVLRVVLPAATGSVITGIMLAVARVAGETAPLLFTALGSRLMPLAMERGIPKVYIDRPFPSLTKQVYDYAMGPYPQQKKLAWAGILVLIGLILVLNVTVRCFTARSRVAKG